MRQKQRQIIAMFTVLIMLLPLIAGCGLRTPNVPTETAGEEKTTAEGEVTTEEPATEEPTEEVLREVIEYHLEPVDSYFRMFIESFKKADDCYLITGDKRWGGMVLLTTEQKGKLEDGAVLKLIYEGEVIDQITLDTSVPEDELGKTYRDAAGSRVDLTETEIALQGVSRYVDREWLTKRLEEEPFNGSGYYLAQEYPHSRFPLDIIVEAGVQLKVPGEIEIYPENYFSYYVPGHAAEYMTIEHFYQEAVVEKNYPAERMYLHVYVSEGEIVEIIDQSLP